MPANPRLPPPDDWWGRFVCGRDGFGRLVWIRPGDLVENHAGIEHLEPRHALDVLEGWVQDKFHLVETIHDRAHGPPADLDPDRRRAVIVRTLREDVGSGWLVFHRERLEDGAPGTEPVQPSRPDPKQPSAPPWRPATTWIEIAVVEGDAAVAREPVLLVDPAGQTHHLRTDDGGVARVDGIDPGLCDVSFPRIDGREWARLGQPFLEGSDAVARLHPAHADECMARIAHRYAFRSPDTLYHHPCNAGLRALRPNPYLLWPGDRVNILQREERTDAAETARRHTYRIAAAARWLRLILHDPQRSPLAAEPYVFDVDGRPPVSRVTGTDGALEEPIPPWATRATVRTRSFEWRLAIAELVPTTRVPDEGRRGARQRLWNLGYPVDLGAPRMARTDTALDLESAPANFDPEVWRFQRMAATSASGELDEATTDAAVALHRI